MSPQNLARLNDCANDSVFDDSQFSQVLQDICKILLSDESKFNHELLQQKSNNEKFHNAYQSLMTLVVESVKNDLQNDQIELVLDDCDFLPNRKDAFLQVFSANREPLQKKLASFGVKTPKIVDLCWRLDYHLKNNKTHKVNALNYTISLKQADGDSIAFQCSKEELQNMISKLKEAAKIMERTSQA